MKVGTDFSGVGAPEQALKNLGVDFESVFACEIDKYARTTFLANHETKTMYEDITKRDHSEIPQLDLYVAGFPCQSFSIAGKRKGFEEARGTLFFNVAEFIKENQPKAFILENVKGLLSHESGRTMQTIIDILSNCGGTVNGQMSLDMFEDGLGYHIYYQVLNTKEHGIPQNRERIFIVGFKEPRDYRFPKEETLELRLKDMLETEVDDKYYLSEKLIKTLTKDVPGFSGRFDPHDENTDVSNCLTARYHKMARTDPFIRVGSATKRGYEEAKEGDSINFSVPNSETRRGRVGKGVAQILDTACNQATMAKDKIRRLTPRECFRLQNFPDSFNITEVSDTQAYKQAGNSITVRVIQKIINKIYTP